MATKATKNVKASKKSATKGAVKKGAAKKAVVKNAAKAKVKGIGAVAIEALQKKPDAAAALAAVLKAHPKAKTTIGCIYWYANQNGISLQKAAA